MEYSDIDLIWGADGVPDPLPYEPAARKGMLVFGPRGRHGQNGFE